MPFFKKKKSEPSPSTKQNGLAVQTNQATVPPMQNFVPPPDIVAGTIAKSNKRKYRTLLDLLEWGKDYFCSFLECEGASHLYEQWNNADNFLNKYQNKSSRLDEEYEQDLKTLLRMISENQSSELFGVDSCIQEDRELDPFILVLQTHKKLYDTLENEYLPKFQDSKFHVKCQVDIFTNGQNLSLYDVLTNQSAMFYFMEYTEQEGKREVLEFLLGAMNFSEQFNGARKCVIDFKTAESDAMVLYEKYISLQASSPLGLRNEIRSEVERLICSPNEISRCFESAIIEAFAFLHVTCFEGFLKSSLFLSFLSDLIGSLKSSKSQQTLDSNSVGSSNSVKSYPPSACSSLTSPVHRPKGKLSLGRINAFGKFEAEFDMELLKKESSISKTVKKLVNYDEKEKAKEELAWQVAAMIINEVTSVTMGPVDQNVLQ